MLEPAGFGRPLPREILDREYSSGAWAHFHGLPELPRQSVICGYVSELHRNPAVLDLGCGSGKLAQLFSVHPFRRYVGVDLSGEGIARARSLQLPKCEFLEGDFETWQPSEQFDVIMFVECIGYARDPGALVARYLPCLAPGGTIVISHFRFGAYRAHWRRVEQVATVFESVALHNDRGQVWDVRLLRPRATAQ